MLVTVAPYVFLRRVRLIFEERFVEVPKIKYCPFGGLGYFICQVLLLGL
jgi:hypothetical protein